MIKKKKNHVFIAKKQIIFSDLMTIVIWMYI